MDDMKLTFEDIREEWGVERAVKSLQAYGYSPMEVYALLRNEFYNPQVEKSGSNVTICFDCEARRLASREYQRTYDEYNHLSAQARQESLGQRALQHWKEAMEALSNAPRDVICVTWHS